jgi:tryptophan-rich sensory protein
MVFLLYWTILHVYIEGFVTQVRLSKGQTQIRNKSFQLTAYLFATPYTVIFTQEKKFQHAHIIEVLLILYNVTVDPGILL